MYRQHWNIVMRILIGTVLVALLVGCGNSATDTGSLKASVPTLSSVPLTDIVTPLPKQGIVFDSAGLHIYSATGTWCQYYAGLGRHPIPLDRDNIPALPHGNLVLSSDQLTYDSNTIEQMKNYAEAFYGSQTPLPPLPASLSWLSAGVCELTMDVTNTGTQAIQLQTMNIRLAAPSQPNQKQYRLVDICSLVTAYCPPQGGGGAGISYTFQLSDGNANTVFTPTMFYVTGMDATSTTVIPVTIGAGETVHIDVALNSSSASIYPIIPNLVLNGPDGAKTVALSQLSRSIYVADNSQFSCYELQGETFVPVDKAGAVGTACI